MRRVSFLKGIPEPKKTKSDPEIEKHPRVDLARECPICRQHRECACVEPDRAFLNRTTWDKQGEIPRCENCSSPLSCLYIPRSNSKPPYDLKDHNATWCCLACRPACAMIVIAKHIQTRSEPPW